MPHINNEELKVMREGGDSASVTLTVSDGMSMTGGTISSHSGDVNDGNIVTVTYPTKTALISHTATDDNGASATSVSEIAVDADTDNGDDGEPATLLTQEAVNYLQVSPYRDPMSDQRICGNCAHWIGNRCSVVENTPIPVNDGGYCDEYEDADDAVADYEDAEREDAPSDLPTFVASPGGAYQIGEQVQTVAIPRNVIQETTGYTDFKGKYPSVRLAVDKSTIKAKDPNPFYVTLKIAEVGRTSKNGVLYDQELVDSIERQIMSKRPPGIFGHIPTQNRDTEHRMPVGFWIGAIREGRTLWGEAYIRDREAAAYIKDLMTMNNGLGTSIYGTSQVETTSDGKKRLRDFDLEQIDFVSPATRASLDMGGEFYISEMSQEGIQMDKAQVKAYLAELSYDDIAEMVGEGNMEKIVDAHTKRKGKKIVSAEFAYESDDFRTTITELTSEKNTLAAQNSAQARELTAARARIAEFERVEFNTGLDTLVKGAINWKTNTTAQEASVNAIRSQLRREVLAELAGSTDLALAGSVVQSVMERDDFRPILETVRDAISGGNLPVNVGGRSVNAKDAVAAAAEDLKKQLWGGV